jgi:8-hydroxy-5-deazaflavin:NADPH oxidoreductase
MLKTLRIGIIGGTGKLGSALAGRWAKAGLKIAVGSRDQPSAEALAASLGGNITGHSNADAAAQADIIVVTVPFSAQKDTLLSISPHVQGKIVLETAVPLVPPKVARVQLPSDGSAAVRAQIILGESVRVISAFHNVAAHKMARETDLDCDVLVFGDEKSSRDIGVALAGAAGLRGIHGGGLANSAAAEAMTSVLIFINKFYSVDGAGIAISGHLIEPA